MTLTLAEIAQLLGAELRGDADPTIRGVAALEDAAEGDLAAIDDPKLADRLAGCGASALLVSPRVDDELSVPHLVVEQPLLALNRVIERLDLLPAAEKRRTTPETEVHPTAVVHSHAAIGEGCVIGPFAVIGEGARIGAGSVLRSHAVVEDGAAVGERCYLHPHVVIGSTVSLGDRVVVGANAVLGASGFAFGHSSEGAERFHHVGRVEVGDDAEIGPGCTVDRARFGATRIGSGTKLDAHVHVAHNCTVGDRTVMAAQVGLAGSTHVGARCQLGGQVGVAGHLTIADDCRIAAMAGVPGDLEKPGTYFGYWAKERSVSFRELAAVARLPGALKELRGMQGRLRHLEEKLDAEDARASGEP